MIKNDQREVLSLDSSMGCYFSLAQVYLKVDCEVMHLNKKDNNLSMHLHMLYDDLLCLLYSFYVHAIISFEYVYC